MEKRSVERTVKVLRAIAEHITKHGESPTIREICVAVGMATEKRIWESVNTLILIGVLGWDRGPSGKGEHRGIKLLVGLNEPTKVPVIGQGFIPGSRWVEFHDDGSIFYVTPDGRTECRAVQV